MNREALSGARTAIDWARVREDFPLLTRQVNGKPLIYLDSANTGQKPASVIQTVDDFYRQHNANVSRAVHTLGTEATDAYEGARKRLARFLNVRPDELVLCSGTTFAINLVAYSWALPRLKAGDTILVSRMEHHANIVPWQLVAQRTGATIKVAEIHADGTLDLDALHAAMTGDVKLLAITHTSNVLGTVNPVREICREARKRGIVTVVDGSQAVPHRAVDVAAIGCDFYALTGHTGTETAVFVLTRGDQQIAINATTADFDTVGTAKAGFNVKAGDVVTVYIVDSLTNGSGTSPTVL